jgi:hypothetical protein
MSTMGEFSSVPPDIARSAERRAISPDVKLDRDGLSGLAASVAGPEPLTLVDLRPSMQEGGELVSSTVEILRSHPAVATDAVAAAD